MDWKFWMPVLAAFVGGAACGVIVSEILRRLARWELYSRELYQRRLLAYAEISSAAYALKLDGDSEALRDIIEKHLPIVSNPVSDILNRVLSLFDGYAVDRVDKDRIVGLNSPKKVEALALLRDLLNAMRDDLAVERLEEGLAQIFHRQKKQDTQDKPQHPA